MTRVVTFGEVMLRLKSPGFERLFQSPQLEATFGGAEANVAVSLAEFGLPVSFVTALPSNPLGESAVDEIRKFGVDTRFIKRAGDRLGIYFLESGSNQRASKVTYDRAGSSIAAAKPGDFDWNAILETNLTGTLRACRVFGRHMIEKRYGRIINIGSLSSFVGLFEVAAYGASKAAVASLTKTLAIEWATSGVCVNALVPGVLRTDLNASLLDGTERGREFLMRTPMGRFGKLDELAGAAVFLASEAASFVTGHLLVVDGGILASGVNK